MTIQQRLEQALLMLESNNYDPSPYQIQFVSDVLRLAMGRPVLFNRIQPEEE